MYHFLVNSISKVNDDIKIFEFVAKSDEFPDEGLGERGVVRGFRVDLVIEFVGIEDETGDVQGLFKGSRDEGEQVGDRGGEDLVVQVRITVKCPSHGHQMSVFHRVP